jgi:hypothetical protein
VAFDPGGASGAAGYRPPPRRVPSPHQPGAGNVNNLPRLQYPSQGPTSQGWDPTATAMANQAMGILQPTLAQSAVTAPGDYRTQFGFRESIDPRNIPDIPGNLLHMVQNPGDIVQAINTPEGRGGLLAGAATAGITGGSTLALPFAKNFRIPKSKSPSQRVLDYPTMDSNIWRLKNQKMGEHAGFKGRLGNLEDRAIVERQRAAPSIEEHLRQLDALQGAQSGGAIPRSLDSMLSGPLNSGLQMENMAKYGARQDRSVAPIHMRERVEAGDYPGLRNPPKKGRPTLSKLEGDALGRALGAFDEPDIPLWESHNFEQGLQMPQSLIERQGINQAKRRGSFMDQGGPMNAEALVDMLSRSGFWRAR